MRTLKHLLTVVAVLGGLSSANAQANFGEFKWGFKAGANFANVNNLEETIKNKKGQVGLIAGGFMKIPLSTSLSIRPELLFNMKGFKFDATDINGNTVDANYRLNYVEVPVSLDFDLFGILDVHGGVQGAFLIGKKLKVGDTKIDLQDEIKNGEYGFHIGAGIDLGNLGLHTRFHQSLSSFHKEDDNFDPRNWGLALTFSFMLY